MLPTNKWILLTSLIYTSAVYADNDPEFEAFLKNHESEFSQYQQQIKQEFQQFEKEWKNAEAEYKKRISKKWETAELPSKKVWVSYSEDLNQRTKVDYEKGVVQIELKKEVIKHNVLIQAKTQLTQLSRTTPTQAIKSDPIVRQVVKAIKVNQQIQTKREQKLTKPVIIEQKPLALKGLKEQPIIKPAVLTQVLTEAPVVKEDKDFVTVTYALPKQSFYQKAQPYLNQVKSESERWKLPPSLLLAIIHTESSFNPMARSSIPAFGLMQIVPSTAGKDVSQFILGEPKLYTPEYLYQASNNIEAGSAYLHLLQNRYFKHVRNQKAKTYLSIAAYNTGIGNVAKTLTGTKSLRQAAIKANLMSPDEIYSKLLRDLPAQETRNYLKKVQARSKSYEQHLKGI
ncbi:transglycosylase SLT domain-containing protein [Parashewanella tropica]|uniref:transglycosylase SLT domain-containing protein n=1 Tax=Parashewanella tropica TaxID=2547970 RepID=UPI00105A1054|nr:transglycosylase SLT domain-containing protein [Parashewanella tropica]